VQILFEYPGHIVHAVSVHYAQQRAGAVSIDSLMYCLSTRWQYSSIFIMIYRDFFVPILQDAVLPAVSIMAAGRFLREGEIDSFLECDDKNVSEFSFEESDSDIQQDSVNAESDSNSDTSDTDGSVVIVDPVAAVMSDWCSVSDSGPEPRIINTINIDSGPVLPSCFDSSTEPVEYFHLFFDEDLLNLIVTETNVYANTKQQIQSPPNKRARTAAWKECSISDIKAIIQTVIIWGCIH
jgi:hypothetical protein